MRKIIAIIGILLLITGCYDNKELNDLAIVTAMNISKQNNIYKVTVQVSNPINKQDETSSDEAKYINYEATGISITNAINNIIKKIPNKLYESQMQLLIIDEITAKNNLNEVIDYFIRNNNTREEFYVLLNKNSSITPLNYSSSENIINILLENNNYLGTTALITLNDLISNYQNNNKEIIIPIIEMLNNNSISLTSIAIFKNNKLVDYLTDEETISYNLITNKINNTIITTGYNGMKYLTSEIIKPKTKIVIKPRKNKLIITIKGRAIIRENNYKIRLKDKDNINKLKHKLNNDIEKSVKKNIININKKYNSDIYGFKDLIYKYHPIYYKKIKNSNNYLNTIKIIINSNIEIIDDGNLLGGINNE